jgi:hypothetical protein
MAGRVGNVVEFLIHYIEEQKLNQILVRIPAI